MSYLIIVVVALLISFLFGRYVQDKKIRRCIANTVQHVNGCDDILVGNAINHIFCLNLFKDEDIRKIIEGIIENE